MKYLFDITHPHFVHFYKNLIKLIGPQQVIVTCQESELIIRLLDDCGIEYRVIGKKYKSLVSKMKGQVEYFIKFIKMIKENEIDIVIGLSPSSILAAKICGKNGILLDDDDSAVQPLTKYFTIPFASYIITPSCLAHENYGSHHLMYRGYQELAYLSPEYFTPNESILQKYGLRSREYAVVRFNDFKAHHDLGQSGMSIKTKTRMISLLRETTKVLITTEGEIDTEFSDYQMLIDPVDIHHIMAYARIFIGDSQTMASEAAVLGTPSVRCNTFKNRISYLKELEEKYKLTYAFLPHEEAAFIEKIKEILSDPGILIEWQKRRNYMLLQMEDVNLAILNIIYETQNN